MKLRLFRPNPRADNIDRLYGVIVAQARNPSFYRAYGVADTLDGRFEMVLLHALLVVRRLGQDPEVGRPLGQGLFDRFCSDMDGTLREMGVGDLTVPKQMRRVGAAFYERQAAYQDALAADDATLAMTVRRCYGPGTEVDAGRFATYIRSAARDLEGVTIETLRGGDVRFPDPAGIVAPA